MKKQIIAYFLLCSSLIAYTQSATNWNPFVNAVDLTPDNGVGLNLGTYSCGNTLTVSFNIGQTTNGFTMPNAALNGTNKLEVDICLVGYTFNGTVNVGGDAGSVVSGTYESFFTWTFISTTCIRGVQNTVIPKFNILTGAGSGSIIFDLKVPIINTCTSCLNVNATLGLPTYLIGSTPGDDVETTNSSVWCRQLPLESLDLKSVSKTDGGIGLTWKTLNESNTKDFEIQRMYGGENNTWMTVGTTPAAGTTSTERTYAFMDKTYAKAEKIYYRIKQIDQSGSYKYTDIRSIQLKEYSTVQLAGYPNPVHKNYHLSFNLPSDAKIGIELIDILGRPISRDSYQARAGYNSRDIDFSTLVAGTYILKVAGSEINDSMTVIKVD